jgi:threonyl-tRNA synthetase
MAVLGEREVEQGNVNLRIHGEKEQLTLSYAEFVALLREKRDSKDLNYG